ncbi:hypothetical protein LXL04_034885 [Taraxacum kok-saghyz]
MLKSHFPLKISQLEETDKSKFTENTSIWNKKSQDSPFSGLASAMSASTAFSGKRSHHHLQKINRVMKLLHQPHSGSNQVLLRPPIHLHLRLLFPNLDESVLNLKSFLFPGPDSKAADVVANPEDEEKELQHCSLQEKLDNELKELDKCLNYK